MSAVDVSCNREVSPVATGHNKSFPPRGAASLLRRKEHKERRAGFGPGISTEGNKGNEVGTGTGFLQEAAEAAEADWRKPLWQEATNSRTPDALSLRSLLPPVQLVRQSAGTGFLQETAEAAEADLRRPRFFARNSGKPLPQLTQFLINSIYPHLN